MARPGQLIPFRAATSEATSWSRLPSSSVLARAVAASTAESITVPSGARYVVFSANADFYVNCYTTATVPGDTTDGTASELNPVCYQIPADVATISVISASVAIITAAFYS